MMASAQAEPSADPSSAPEKPKLMVRGAVFLGVGAMVGAGIFALLGEAGAVAGSAVWISFLVLREYDAPCPRRSSRHNLDRPRPRRVPGIHALTSQCSCSAIAQFARLTQDSGGGRSGSRADARPGSPQSDDAALRPSAIL